ncbi:MAG: SBBP repeat-containing protein [Anaerolineales bacterium]|nr:SBBP repeat-containing protein [Anaerolineales bacterium]
MQEKWENYKSPQNFKTNMVEVLTRIGKHQMKMTTRKLASIFVFLTMLGSVFSSHDVKAITIQPAPPLASGEFLWAKSMGGEHGELGIGVKTDSNGNVYTAGNFRGTGDFDPGPNVFNLTAAGDFSNFFDAKLDGFVSKLDINGNFVWARRLGGVETDQIYDMAVDTIGNVYITGYFEGTVDFGLGAGVSSITSAGERDIFICKLDSNGNLLWAKRMGGTSFDEGNGIIVDANGNVYTTGYFIDIADFDPGAGTFNLVSAGSWDIFISKLDTDGNFVWAKRMGGAGSDISKAIAMDANNSIIITGNFQLTADFNPGAGIHNLVSIGNDDIFVSKLDKDGNLVWAKQIGGTGSEEGLSVAVDSTGNILTTGFITSNAPTDFDPGSGTYYLIGNGNYDIFISKLDSGGNFVWAKSIGGQNYDVGYSIAVDSDDNIFTTGYYSFQTVDFDPGLGTFYLENAGQSDIFILKMSNGGELIWAKSIGGTSSDRARGVHLDSSNNIYVTGYFSHTVDFDPGAGITNLHATGDYSDIFVLKLKGSSIFNDVPFNGFGWAQIEAIYNAGITGGCTTTPLNYCPNNTVTRAQMAIFLLRGIHGSSYTPPAVGDGTGFNDVPTTHSAAAWIKQLAAEGITGGCGNGNYCPNQAVTRAQMAIFLLRAKYGDDYVPPAVGGSSGFNDVPAGSSTAPWIKQLAAEGITGGCGNGNFCPNNPVTRSQMAIFLQRAFNLPLP